MNPPSAKWPWWIAALASAVVLGLLATNRGFYNADELDLLANPAAPWWDWHWFAFEPSLFYRPLGYAVFTIQLHAVGGDPVFVHTISVLHHVVNAALFAAVLGRLGLPRRIALLAFVPSAVPGIAWVAGAYDRAALSLLLVVTLLLLARRALPLLAIVVFAIAIVSKETAIGFVVPALLIAWRRRRETNRAFVVAAVAAITTTAITFAIWRLVAIPRVPEYAVAFDLGNVVRTARLVVFPFAPTAMDPSTVWGVQWFGALPGLAFGVIALRGSVPWTIAGVATAAAAIAPIALLPKVEGHYLYLATPGLLLVVAAALRDMARASRVVLAALFALAIVHSGQIALDYRVMGHALNELQAAHRAAAKDAPFVVYAPGWRGASTARRYQVHADACSLAPIEIVDAPRAGAWIVADDGSVQRAK